MYVCNCNGITQRQVRTAKDAGARQWTDVHAHFGCEPCCGCCGVEISDMLQGGSQTDRTPLMAPGLAKA